MPNRETLVLSVLVGLAAATALVAGADLPRPAEAAVKAAFPQASILNVAREREGGVDLLEVVVRDGDREYEIELADDGVIRAIETAVPLSEVPRAALERIVERTDGAPVREVERSELRARVVDGRLVPFDSPLVVYEVEYERDGVVRELVVGEDGRIALEQDEQDEQDDGRRDDDD